MHFRRLLTLIAGTGLGQVITFLVMPLVSRMYGPDLFGYMGAVLAIAAPIVVVFSGRFQIALLIPVSNTRARDFYWGGVFLAFVAGMASLLLPFFGPLIVEKWSSPEMRQLLWLSPVSVTVTLLSMYGVHWRLRQDEFRRISYSVVLVALVSAVFRLLLGLVAPSALALFGALVLSQVVGVLVLGFPPLIFPSKLDLLALWKRYKDFPMYRVPQDLLSSITRDLPSIVFLVVYDATAVGLFWLGYRTITMPLYLLSDPLRKYYAQVLAERVRNREGVMRTILCSTGLLFLLSAVIFGGLIWIGVPLFPRIFGKEWTGVQTILPWLGLWVLSGFPNIPIVSLIPSIRRQGSLLIWEIVASLLRTLTLLYVTTRYSITQSLMYFAFVNALLYLSLIILGVFWAYVWENNQGDRLSSPVKAPENSASN